MGNAKLEKAFALIEEAKDLITEVYNGKKDALEGYQQERIEVYLRTLTLDFEDYVTDLELV